MFLMLYFIVFPDKTENTVGVNIKLRLSEEGGLDEGAPRGPTLEFVLEKDQVLLKEEEEEELRREEKSQQQSCRKATENERTKLCSADSSQTPNSNRGPDTNPWPDPEAPQLPDTDPSSCSEWHVPQSSSLPYMEP